MTHPLFTAFAAVTDATAKFNDLVARGALGALNAGASAAAAASGGTSPSRSGGASGFENLLNIGSMLNSLAAGSSRNSGAR